MLCPKVLRTFFLNILIISIFLAVASFNSSNAFAATLGTNLEWRTVGAGDDAALSNISQASGGAAVPVTAVVDTGDLGGLGGLLDKLEGYGFGPIILRLTFPGNQALNPADGCLIAQQLNPHKGRLHAVEFGNEINLLDREWIGGDYPQYWRAYESFASCAEAGLRIGPAAASPPGGGPNDPAVYIQSASNAARVDVLFFNTYDNRTEAEWGVDDGCDENAMFHACSWQKIRDMYAGKGITASEHIFTEFSLHPEDPLDNDLCSVKKFIETVGPRLSEISYITPLIYDPKTPRTSPQWLYYINADPTRIIDMDGNVREECGTEAGGTSDGGLFGFLKGLIARMQSRKQAHVVDYVDCLEHVIADPYQENPWPWCGYRAARNVEIYEDKGGKKQTHQYECRATVSEIFEMQGSFAVGTVIEKDWHVSTANTWFGGTDDLLGATSDGQLGDVLAATSIQADILPFFSVNSFSSDKTQQLSTDQLRSGIVGGYFNSHERVVEEDLDDATMPIYEKMRYAAKYDLLAPLQQQELDREYWIKQAFFGLLNSWNHRRIEEFPNAEDAYIFNVTHDHVACYVNNDNDVRFVRPSPEDGAYRPVRYSEFLCRDEELLSRGEIWKAACAWVYGIGFKDSGVVAADSRYAEILSEDQRAIAPDFDFLREGVSGDPDKKSCLYYGVRPPPDYSRADLFLDEQRLEHDPPTPVDNDGNPLHPRLVRDNQYGESGYTMRALNMLVPYNAQEETNAVMESEKTIPYCSQAELSADIGDPAVPGTTESQQETESVDVNTFQFTFQHTFDGTEVPVRWVDESGNPSNPAIGIPVYEFTDSRDIILQEYPDDNELETVLKGKDVFFSLFPHSVVEEFLKPASKSLVSAGSRSNVLTAADTNEPKEVYSDALIDTRFAGTVDWNNEIESDVQIPQLGAGIILAFRKLVDEIACPYLPGGAKCGVSLVGGTGTGDTGLTGGQCSVEPLTSDTSGLIGTIAILGDSMMVHDEGGGNVSAKLQSLFPNASIHNFGVPGRGMEVVMEVRRGGADDGSRIIDDVILLKPDVLIIESFAYNSFFGTELNNIIATIQAHSPNTQIVLATTIAPDCSVYPGDCRKVESDLQAMKSYAQGNYPFANAYDASLGKTGCQGSDGVHPTGDAALLFATEVARVIVESSLLQ